MESSATTRFELRVRNVAYQPVRALLVEYRNRWAQYSVIPTHPFMDEFDRIDGTEMRDALLEEKPRRDAAEGRARLPRNLHTIKTRRAHLTYHPQKKQPIHPTHHTKHPAPDINWATSIATDGQRYFVVDNSKITHQPTKRKLIKHQNPEPRNATQ